MTHLLSILGNQFEELDTFKRATEGYSKTNYCTARRVLPHYFLFLDQTPDQVIEIRKRDLISDDVTENERYERRDSCLLEGNAWVRILAGRTVTSQ